MKQKGKDYDVNTNKNLKLENENRVNELINTVERHTRTERHLEQHSDIASPDQVKHAKEVQHKREEDIENLKNTIVNGKTANEAQFDNLEQNYHYTQGYLEHNQDHMNSSDVEKVKEKQEHRKDQMKFLK